MTDRDDRTRTEAGRFYGRRFPGDRLHEVAPEDVGRRPPDVVICRRVADYAGGRVPPEAARGSCAQCGAAIAFNPARFPERPHVCFQCGGIEPLPFPV